MEIAMADQMVRLSASVPKHIVEETDEIASARKVSRSQLISECLTEMIQKKKEQLLAEGYKAMAKQHGEFASLTENNTREVMPDW
jgi:metal-responsive CopG/Arc/MetJ family transcriptional regulator